MRYELTPAGEGLAPIVWAMGHWAAEWAFGDPRDEELDGLSLLWRLHQHALPDRVPADRTVVHIVLTGPHGAQGWLDINRSTTTVCRTDPGRHVDLAVEADNRQMHRWLLGLVPFRALVVGWRRPAARTGASGARLPELVRHLAVRRRAAAGRVPSSP